MTRPLTFEHFERRADARPRKHIAQPHAWEDCGGCDDERERWCPRGATDRYDGALTVARKADGSGDWSGR